MSNTELNFDLEPRTLKVTIFGKPYVLREAMGDAVVKYRNKVTSAASLSSEGKLAKVGNIADAEPGLVASCLYRVTDTGVEELVTEQFVRNLPNRIMKRLYDTIKEISDMDEVETKESLMKQKKDIEQKLTNLENKDEDEKNF